MTKQHKTMTVQECNNPHCQNEDHFFEESPAGAPVNRTKILINIREEDGPSPVDHIIQKHLNPVIQLFRQKARDYEATQQGLFTANLLGSRGQFGDLWRKIPKLYKGLWLREKLVGEQPAEILADFIGHCFLALGFLDDEDDLKPQPSAPNLNPGVIPTDRFPGLPGLIYHTIKDVPQA